MTIGNLKSISPNLSHASRALCRWRLFPNRFGCAGSAAIVISLGASMWFARKKHKLDGGEVVARSSMSAPEAKSQAPSLALVPLTQLALQDPEQFDARLIAASPTVLPDFGD